MGNIPALLVLGISYGLILFLLATGLTLTMGLMRIVNMSHGAIYTIAGYLGIWVVKTTGSWLLGLIAGGILAALFGLLLEVAFLRRLYNSPTSQVLLTIGFINIINNAAQWIFGTSPLSAQVPKMFSGAILVGSIPIATFRFVIIVFGLIMAVLLWLLQDKTKVGAMVRAGMDNGEIAGTIGINKKVLFTSIFVLGSLIAGISSMIGGTITGINAGTSWNVLLNSIIVVVVGGAGSIPGALLGGIIIGLVNAFGTIYFPAFASFVVYAVLIIVLLIKPAGLLGRKLDVNKAVEDTGKARTLRRINPGILAREAILSGAKLGGRLTAYRFVPYVLVVIILVALPNFIGTFSQSMMTKVLIYALLAMSLDVIMGYAGMRSFGHAAFFGFGGYAVGLLARYFGIDSFWAVFPIIICASALLSAIIGYFTVKLSGTYFLMVTMAFGQLLTVVAEKWYKVTGGTDGLMGIPKPNLGFDIKWDSGKIYYFTLIIFVVCYIVLHIIMNSSYGRSLVGVRENEGRMKSLGFDTRAAKYVGMIIAGVFAGIAGLLYAYAYNTMVPGNFALEMSAMPMLMVIMGGGATLWGPALGALVIILVQNWSGNHFPDRWPMLLGAMYVVCVMFLKGGFARYLSGLWYMVGDKLFGFKKKAPVVKTTVSVADDRE